MRPTVAVVIPVHNADAYLEATLQSVYDQTLPQDQVSIIAVDDGSTDGSLALLQAHAAEHSNLVVHSRPASGSPSGPRNLGIETATADYLFFLDADDLLTPRALERMVDAAVENDADVVLCKMDALNGRRGVPRSMFTESRAEADIVEHNLFNALGPTKLFRREHLLQHGLRFPTHLRVGEDKPFVAEALLTSRHTSVVADEPYYLVRERDDPSEHLGRASETSDQAVSKAELLAHAIERHTEPGERRDAMLHRAFGGSFQNAFRTKLARMNGGERQVLLDRTRDSLGRLWTTGVRDRQEPIGRVIGDLVFAGRAGELVELESWRAAHKDRLVRGDGDRWVLDLPERVSAAVGGPVPVASPRVAYGLSGMRVEQGGALVVRGWAGLVGLDGGPSRVVLRLVRRGSEESVEVEARLGSTVATAGVAAARFVARVDPAPLEHAAWDAFLVLGSADATSQPQRFGSRRDEGVGTAPLVLADQGTAYFTATYSNLTIDRGFTVTARPPAVRVVGADRAPTGSPRLYLDTGVHRPEDLAVAIDLHGARRVQLRATRVGPRTASVELPEPHVTTSIAARATVGDEEMPLDLPGGIAFPPHPSAARAEVVDGVLRLGPGPVRAARSPAAWVDGAARDAKRLVEVLDRRLPRPVRAAARRARARLRGH